MTTPPDTPRLRLGVGGVVADTLVLFFTRLHWVALFSIPAFLVAGGIGYLLMAPEALNLMEEIGDLDPWALLSLTALAALLSAPAGVAGGLLAGAMALVQADVAAGRRVGVGRAFRAMLVRAPQLILTGTLAAMLFALAWTIPFFLTSPLMILVSLPLSAYVFANAAVVLPVIALDGGFRRAFARSRYLLDGHRWSATLAFAILIFAAVIFSSVISAILGMTGLLDWLDWGDGVSMLFTFLTLLMPFVMLIALVALPAIAAAVVQRRLVEIVEGMNIEDAVAVFD